jgi:hypothetical protein
MRLQEIARRIYGDLVQRRAAVRISTPDSVGSGESPFFILGAYRSGTTLLRYCLDSHSRIAIPPESEFIAAMEALVSDEAALDGLGALGFDVEHVRLRTREFCSYFFNSYAWSKGKPRWGDKTPRYLGRLGLLQWLYPDAPFVMIVRHPLDQIHSFTRGGAFVHEQLVPYVGSDLDARIAASFYWRDTVDELIRAYRAHSSDTVIIRYEDLCCAPRKSLGLVLECLGEAWEDGVETYYMFEHDLGREAGRVTGTRGFSLRSRGYEGWPEEIRSRCTSIVSEHMELLGYSGGRSEPSGSIRL